MDLFNVKISKVLLLMFFSILLGSMKNTNASGIEDILLSPEGDQYVTINKDSSERYSFTFGNTRMGPIDKLRYAVKDEIQFSKKYSDFYLPVRTKSFKSGFLTKRGYSGPLDGISDDVFFTEKGLIYAYVKNGKLVIHTPENEISTGYEATHIGSFFWNEGDFKVMFNNRQEAFVAFAQKRDSLFPSYYVSDDRFSFTPEGHLIGVLKKDDKRYVTGLKDNLLGPYEKVSEKVTYDSESGLKGFVYQKEKKGYVWVNGQTFGPFSPFERSSSLQFTGEDEGDFVYYYLNQDRSLFIQKANTQLGPFQPEGLRGPMPELSKEGSRIRITANTPKGDIIQINNEVYGPFGHTKRFFYKNFVTEDLDVFRFKKHGKAFLFLDGDIAGPFDAVDYSWDGKRLAVASVSPGTKQVKIKRYNKRKFKKLPRIDPTKLIPWESRIKDVSLEMKLPFSWQAVNIYKITRMLPMLMASPDKVDFEQVLNSVDSKKLPDELERLLIISHQGGEFTHDQMVKLIKEGQAFDAEIEEIAPVENVNLEDREAITRTIRLKRDKNQMLVKQLAFKQNGEWLLCYVYATDETKTEMFPKAEHLISGIRLK